MKKNRFTQQPQGSGSFLEHQGLDHSPYGKSQVSTKRSLSGLDKALIALSTALVLVFVSLVAPWLLQQFKSEDTHRSAEVDYIEVVALENPQQLSRSESDMDDADVLDKTDIPFDLNLSRFNGTKVESFTEDFADSFRRVGDDRLEQIRKDVIDLPTRSARALLHTANQDNEIKRTFATIQPVATVAPTVAPTAAPTAAPTVAPTMAPTLPPTNTEAQVYVTTPTTTIPETTPTFEAVTEPTESLYEPTETLPVTDEPTSETEYVTEPTTLETTPEPTTTATPRTPEPTTTPAPTTAPPDVSLDDMDLFYRVIAAESGGFWDIEGRTRIAEVIVTRVNAGQGTLYEVLTAKDQFSVVSNGRIYTINVSEADRVAAHRALAGANPLLPTNTLYFCTDWAYANYSWFQSLTVVEKYYNVYFMAP